MGTCMWDKGGENKHIKLQSRLFTLSSSFYKPQPLNTRTHTCALASSSFSSPPSSSPPLPQDTLSPLPRPGRLFGRADTQQPVHMCLHRHTPTRTDTHTYKYMGKYLKNIQTSTRSHRDTLKSANTHIHTHFLFKLLIGLLTVKYLKWTMNNIKRHRLYICCVNKTWMPRVFSLSPRSHPTSRI